MGYKVIHTSMASVMIDKSMRSDLIRMLAATVLSTLTTVVTSYPWLIKRLGVGPIS